MKYKFIRDTELKGRFKGRTGIESEAITKFQKGTEVEGRYIPASHGAAHDEKIKFTYKGAVYLAHAARNSPLMKSKDTRPTKFYRLTKDYNAYQHLMDQRGRKPKRFLFKKGEKILIGEAVDIGGNKHLVAQPVENGVGYRLPASVLEPIDQAEAGKSETESNNNALVIIGIGALAFVSLVMFSR